MLEEKDARGWHLWGPLLLTAGAYGYVHNMPSEWDVKALFYVAGFISASWAWRINACIVIRKGLEAKWNTPADAEPTEEVKPVIPPIKVDGLVYASDTIRVKERDPRIIQWAYAVTYENSPLTQSKWAGRKRLFSKPEYVRWIGGLLKDKIVVPVNLKSHSSTYRPNGAQGRKTIKDLADGRIYIPLPVANLTELDTQFLSARMREPVSVGEWGTD
jgi:hypothetical protein